MSLTHNDRVEHDRQIVITGMGIISPFGRTAAQFWNKLNEPSEAVEGSGSGEAVCAPGVADFNGRIDDFDDLPATTRKKIRKSLKVMNRETQMGVAAGQQALLSSQLLEYYDAERVGVCFGAGNVSVMPEDFQSAVGACSDAQGEFEMDRWGTDGLSEMAPLWLLKCLPNMPTCHLAIINDLRGPNNTITQRDVSFALAIAEACRNIKSGDADAMLVGATGTTLNSINLMHARLENEVCDDSAFSDNKSLDATDHKPFPGEGAGAVILEDLHAAQDRGAHIYGEVLGSASASFIGHDGVSACGQALASAMRQSLRRACLFPSGVGHIHAHGLGSVTMSRAESQAIRDVFGPADVQRPVVATKSRLGNAGAGAGAMEMIASLLALQNGRLFPADPFGVLNSDGPICSGNDGEVTAGDSFLSLSMLGRGLGSCIAVGAFRD